MNERFTELAIQARNEFEKNFSRSNDRTYVEILAELIVRECIQTLRDNTPVVDEHDSVEDWDRGYIRGMVDCEHHIKEHFGVE